MHAIFVQVDLTSFRRDLSVEVVTLLLVDGALHWIQNILAFTLLKVGYVNLIIEKKECSGIISFHQRVNLSFRSLAKLLCEILRFKSLYGEGGRRGEVYKIFAIFRKNNLLGTRNLNWNTLKTHHKQINFDNNFCMKKSFLYTGKFKTINYKPISSSFSNVPI